MTASDPAVMRLQAASLDTAVSYGEPIDQNDVQWIMETLDVPLIEVAQALGRSYHSVTTMRWRATQGDLRPARTRVAASDRPYRGWVEGMGDE